MAYQSRWLDAVRSVVRSSDAFGLSTSGMLCSASSALGGVGGSGFFGRVRLLRHFCRICAPSAAKTMAMPTASIVLSGWLKKMIERTTERNCRTVCIVAKTSGPKRLIVWKMKS